MGPVVQQLEKEYAGRVTFKVFMVDRLVANTPAYQEVADLAGRIGFNVTPTYLVVNRDGHVASKYEGVRSYLTLKADLEQALAAR